LLISKRFNKQTDLHWQFRATIFTAKSTVGGRNVEKQYLEKQA